MPRCYFAHGKDGPNLLVLRMFDATVSVEAGVIKATLSHGNMKKLIHLDATAFNLYWYSSEFHSRSSFL